ncbi:MAG: pantetheine-phosphate adenylyltransferase [Tissierellia bacterium]|nr:pantetheine-phosphate adenylyltransferase [Tissierellia bacterium]
MIVIYPGSFDPVTKGHMDIIERVSKKFEKVIVAVLVNSEKKTLFTLEEREKILENEIKSYGLSNVEVERFDGLLVDFAREHNSNIVVRGLRAISDYEYELQIAHINSDLYNELETIFLVAKAEYSYISSSVVKEIASYNGDISSFVSKNVEKEIKKKQD